MTVQPPSAFRELKLVTTTSDLVIVGGGLAGTCAAISAAREGLKVTLLQDRPILGGNSSSEVRLWILGSTSHMGNNNRWAREGGLIDEILIENLYRNKEGNPLVFDTLLLEKVLAEPGITLRLNTAVFEAQSGPGGAIQSVKAICSQNSTLYEVSAPLFCDASGDGVLAFMAGGAFRMGAETRQEFNEGFAPEATYGELLGHTIYFYSKDTGKPVDYVAPEWALTDITKIPRYRSFTPKEHGCKLWWIEYGGRRDTVHETEDIKWELWKVVYGAWNHIKNSGEFPEARNLTLEWVGPVPGKRESRRFEGDYLINQRDIVEQHTFDDAVAVGGWSIDLHPSDGVYSAGKPCNQWHSRGVYQIPYRCLYSRNVPNLFLAGRIISATHVAFGSTRVQGTLAHAAQVVGPAAALCLRHKLGPRDLLGGELMQQLQQQLLVSGQYIPGIRQTHPANLALSATVTASSTLRLDQLPADGPTRPLAKSWAQLVPVAAGRVPAATFLVTATEATDLQLELRTSNRPDNHTPDVVLATRRVAVKVGSETPVTVDFDVKIDLPRYVFFCLMQNPAVSVRLSEARVTGLLSVCNGVNAAVSNFGRQTPPPDIGVEGFEFWCPERRPGGQTLALTLKPPVEAFAPEAVLDGWGRPSDAPHAWVAATKDDQPWLRLRWNKPQTVSRVVVVFDADFDHPLESVQWGHPERAVPFCVKSFRLLSGAGKELARVENNHQSRYEFVLPTPLATDELTLEVLAMNGEHSPAAVFEVLVF